MIWTGGSAGSRRSNARIALSLDSLGLFVWVRVFIRETLVR